VIHGLYAPGFALRWLLRRLPSALLAPLDAWSRREARRRAERRRQAQPARR
jgi:hypothetical protein